MMKLWLMPPADEVYLTWFNPDGTTQQVLTRVYRDPIAYEVPEPRPSTSGDSPPSHPAAKMPEEGE